MKEPVIEDVHLGSGREVEKRDVVSVRLTMRLNRGDVVVEDRQVSFQVGARSVLAGIEKGVLGMRAGGTRRLSFGPHLGYGNAGAPGIPPHAKLDCIVELLALCAEGEPGPVGIRRMIRKKPRNRTPL
jgi:FKBP-type peptidyl-prolyl cis-trans isomerase